MTRPWLFEHRDERGPRGRVARWWYARRVRRVKAALDEHRQRQEESSRVRPRASADDDSHSPSSRRR